MIIRDAIRRLRDETGLSWQECFKMLRAENKVLSGGDSTNGLLANGKGGASLLINTCIARERGACIKELRKDVTQCKRVKNPDKKIADHLRNCQEYARTHRIGACDIKDVVDKLGLLSSRGATVPAVCVNGIPAQDITLRILLSWAEGAILTSPLLAAIEAYKAGKPAPQWVRAYMADVL